MLVYGDPQYAISRADAREKLAEYFARAVEGGLEPARDLVIALGQIEQALADGDAGKDLRQLAVSMQATDHAAENFVSQLLNKFRSPEVLTASAEAAMLALEGAGELHIKLPEGFAFYSLFPEQYVAAAEVFTAHRRALPTLVVGIRTIGTTLSAVVKAALAARGFPAERITVRPAGHPFDRTTDLSQAPEADSAIIVDEGPGLSGSSMASVASALRARGASDITFFPSHAKPPGSAASAETRKTWLKTPCIVKPFIDGDLSPSRIVKALRRETEALLNSPTCEVEDFSAGRWASRVKSHHPIHLAPAFERSKYLIRTEAGASIIWKYAGVGPGQQLEQIAPLCMTRQNALAAKGWCPPALARCHGFIATKWIERHEPPQDNPSVRALLANYIADASRPPLTVGVAEDGIFRLREMMRCNYAEAGLHHVLDYTETIIPNVQLLAKLPAYGDGRLAPHEWFVSGGRLQKADVWGHDFDHTLVGAQSILWDVAGAQIEWLASGVATSQPVATPIELSFYLSAYIAFRIGMCSLAGDGDGQSHYCDLAERLLRTVGA